MSTLVFSPKHHKGAEYRSGAHWQICAAAISVFGYSNPFVLVTIGTCTNSLKLRPPAMEDCEAMEEEEIVSEKTPFCRQQNGEIQDDVGRCVICTHVCVHVCNIHAMHATYMHATYVLATYMHAHMPGNA